jgi:periplasmic divalent cation tolerance protein
MHPLMVYITTRDKKQARRIGRALVDSRLAACANIIGGMNSFYFWEGKLCDDREAVLIVKTRDTLLDNLIKMVKALHTYKVPCIVALPIVGGNREYLAWLKQETSQRNATNKRRASA